MKPNRSATRFHHLVWPHAGVIMREARRLTRDEHDANDLMQDTMLRAFRGIGRFQGKYVKSWLLTILHRTRVDHFRRGSRFAKVGSLDSMQYEPASSQSLGVDGRQLTANDLLDSFSCQPMIDALLTLSEQDRVTLLLAEASGLKHQEAAAALGIPVGTVKSRAHRLRAVVRKALASRIGSSPRHLTWSTQIRLSASNDEL